MDLADRLQRVLRQATYLTLSTVSPEGRPWAAVLQYMWLADPLRFLFGSAIQSWHSQHLAARPTVSGALFVTGDGGFGDVDGAQFTGTCRELTADEVQAHHAAFYEALLPDPKIRAEYALPVAALLPPANHRIYQITVDRIWLLDSSTWLEDRIDRRVEVPLR